VSFTYVLLLPSASQRLEHIFQGGVGSARAVLPLLVSVGDGALCATIHDYGVPIVTLAKGAFLQRKMRNDEGGSREKVK